MHRNIAMLLIAFAFFTLTVRAEDVLKCYMCTSVTDKECGREVKIGDQKPKPCTFEQMSGWQAKIKQHPQLSSIADFFDVDNPQHDESAPKDMACAKVDFKEPGRDTILTIRNCQAAKTETLDPCRALEAKLPGTMEFCGLCQDEACNDSIAPSPKFVYVLFSLFGSLLVAATLYRNA